MPLIVESRVGVTLQQIRRGAHRSTRELEAAIKRYLALTNDAPKPFVWTKTADEILESVAAFVGELRAQDTSRVLTKA